MSRGGAQVPGARAGTLYCIALRSVVRVCSQPLLARFLLSASASLDSCRAWCVACGAGWARMVVRMWSGRLGRGEGSGVEEVETARYVFVASTVGLRADLRTHLAHDGARMEHHVEGHVGWRREGGWVHELGEQRARARRPWPPGSAMALARPRSPGSTPSASRIS